MLLHVECRSGSPAVLSADKSRQRLNRRLRLLPLHPSIAFVPMRCGLRASRKPHRNPGPVSQTRIRTAKHSAINHTRDITHFLTPPFGWRCFVCAMSSASDALFPSGAPVPSTLPDDRSTQPTLTLAVDTRSVLQNRRTVRRQCRAPENVQSRFGRRPTYQRHASSINRILPEAFGCYPSSFPQFARIRNTTQVTRYLPKGRSGSPCP